MSNHESQAPKVSQHESVDSVTQVEREAATSILSHNILLLDLTNQLYHEMQHSEYQRTYSGVGASAPDSGLKRSFEGRVPVSASPAQRADLQYQFAMAQGEKNAKVNLESYIDTKVLPDLGLTEDAPERDAVRAQLLEIAMLDPEDWYGSQDDDNEGVRNIYLRTNSPKTENTQSSVEANDPANNSTNHTSHEPGVVPTEPHGEFQSLTKEEWDNQKSSVESQTAEYVKKYAELVAERSKSMFEGAATREEIAKNKEDASDLVSAMATQMMDELQAAGKSDVEIAATIDVFINEQLDKLMKAMEDHRIAEFDNQAPWKKRLYEMWGKWDRESYDENGKRRWLSKGSLSKFASVALPAVGAGVAIATMPVAGAVAGAGVIGGVVMSARSIGKRLAGTHMDRQANEKRLANEQSEEMKAEYAELIAADDATQRSTIFEVADDYSNYYRKQNRNRMIAGVAIAGTVGAVSGTAASMLNGSFDGGKLGNAYNWVKEKMPLGGGSDTEADSSWFNIGPYDGDKEIFGDRDGDGILNFVDEDIDGDGALNNEDRAPYNPNISDPIEGSGDVQSGTQLSEQMARDDIFNGQEGSRHLTPEGKAMLYEGLRGHVVQPGDSVWDIAEHHLQGMGIEHPTVYEIDTLKDEMLVDLGKQGLVDENGWLHVGDTLSLNADAPVRSSFARAA